MPRVIAYSWEADVHCTPCSKIRGITYKAIQSRKIESMVE